MKKIGKTRTMNAIVEKKHRTLGILETSGNELIIVVSLIRQLNWTRLAAAGEKK